MAAKAASHPPHPLAPAHTAKKAPTFAAMADSAATSALRCSSLSAFGAASGGRRLPWAAPRSVAAGSRRRQRVWVVRAASWGERESDEGFGGYPWEPGYGGDGGFEWVPEERVTLFTTDGLLQIGGSLVPRRISSSEKKRGGKVSKRVLRFQEKDYMDPSQGLCLGALFDIAATNGLDMGRRLCIFGFCRSIEMLSDVVEETVLEHGGEVVVTEKASAGGLQEKLTMTVAVPLLWGVPPASETLRVAVKSGGGIVEKVYWKWDFF